jgi:hypothetical protein
LSCYHYDAGAALGYGFDYALLQGLDIDEPLELKKAIRSIRFAGCTGFVVFDQESNNRGNISFEINNFRDYDTDPKIVKCGLYVPGSGQVFRIEHPIIFPDGTTTPPPDVEIIEYDCPLDQPDAENFDEGVHVLVYACSFYLLLVVGIAVLLWKRLWSFITIPMLSQAVY